MPTDRISPPSSLAETLRALSRDRTRETTAAYPSSTDTHPRVEGKPGIGQLKERLRNLARDVDASDAQAFVAVRDNALREILLWEFGSDFRKDAQFVPMVEAIGKAMDVDADYRQRFTELLTDLQKA